MKNTHIRPKTDLVTVKILREDMKRIKQWALDREMKFYEIVNSLINKQWE